MHHYANLAFGAFNACLFVSLLFAVGKKYAVDEKGNGYEGLGQAGLYKVGYGAGATGIFTAFAAGYHFWKGFQFNKSPSSAALKELSGASIIMAVLLLNCAIVWGNITIETMEMSTTDLIVDDLGLFTTAPKCAGGDNPTCSSYCFTTNGDNACLDGPEGSRYGAQLKPNPKARPPADAVCCFSVFLFLITGAQIFFQQQMAKEGMAGGGEAAGIYSGGAGGSSSVGNDGQGGSSDDTSGDGYQRL